MKRRSFLFGILLLLVVFVFASCNSNDNDNNMSYKYHRQNVEELSNILGSTVATSVVTALEKSCAIEENTKLVGQDLIKIDDNTCVESMFKDEQEVSKNIHSGGCHHATNSK